MDEYPTVTDMDQAEANLTDLSVPLDSIVGDPTFLSIANRLPSFAGYYFNDEGKLVIALTEVSHLDAAKDLVASTLSKQRSAITFTIQHVKYSLLELARYRTILRGRVFDISGVVMLGIDESDNRVKIGIAESAATQKVFNLLAMLGIPETAVNIIAMPYPVALSHTLLSQYDTIHGGRLIAFQAAGDTLGCTLGLAAIRSNGTPTFVTNSHCTPEVHALDGGLFYNSADLSGLPIGHEILDPATRTCGWWGFEDPCRASDAALIKADIPLAPGKIARTINRSGADESGASLMINHTDSMLTITSRNNNVVENETLHKIGWRTGWAYGAVEDSCADYEVNGWVRQCSDRIDFAADHGDSGAPVFELKADGTVELRGIVWGWVGWWNGVAPFNDAIISDLAQIEIDLGPLQVMPDGPDPPPAPTFTVRINGPTQVQPGMACTWIAQVSGGQGPFSYEWYIDNTFAGIGKNITRSFSPPEQVYQIYVTVWDNGLASSGDDMIVVYLSESAPGCLQA